MALTTTFVGVDADAIGNGDDDETLPVDTWLQNRINLNNLNMLAPKVGYTWSPIGGSGGTFTSYGQIRPYCADEWFSIWRGYVWVYPGQTGLKLTMAYHADTPGNTTQAGTVYAKVRCDDGTDTGAIALASTYSSGIKTGHQTIAVTFTEPVRVGRLMRITINVRSSSTVAVSTAIGDSANGNSTTVYHRFPYTLYDSDNTDPGYFDPNNTSGTPPSARSLEAMYILGGTHSAFPDAAGKRYDLVYAGDQSSTGTIAGTLRTVIPVAPATASTTDAYMHVCLMLRAVHFAPTFPLVFQTNEAKGKYAPIQEFGAAEAMFQAQEVIRAYRQPTVALVGPRGKMGDTAFTESDLDGFAANGYAVHWPTIRGDYDNSTSGQLTDIINEGFYLRTENPILELVCQWVSIQHGAPYNQNQNLSESQKFKPSEGGFDKVDVTVSEGAGSAKWDMTASVHQLDDAASGTGSWATDVTEYGSLSESVRIPVIGGDVTNAGEGTPPILRGMDSMEQVGKGDTTNPGFWFKEGSIFNDDIDVIYETRHTITLSGMAQAQTLLPFRLKVNMDLNAFTDPVKVGLTDAALQDDLRLTLVNFTLIEHPQDP